MIQNSLYKQYAGDIGTLFCKGSQNKEICIASVKQRLINLLNNEVFEKEFLPGLGSNRFLSFDIIKIIRNTPYTDQITLSGTDVVTGNQTGNIAITVPIGLVQLKKWDAILQQKNYRFAGNVDNKIIARKPGSNYGIIYVPGQVENPPDYGTGTGIVPPGTINIKPAPIPIYPTPPAQPATTSPGGLFDSEWFLPVLILAGIGFYISVSK